MIIMDMSMNTLLNILSEKTYRYLTILQNWEAILDPHRSFLIQHFISQLTHSCRVRNISSNVPMGHL